MKRRRLLVGFGAMAAGSLGAVGTGAFSSTRANRDAEISIAQDDEAYLRLTASDTNFAYTDTDGMLTFEFNEDFRNYAGGTETGDGLGTDSVYEFTDLFNVENQGANDVQVYGQYEDPDGVKAVELFDSHDSSRSALTETSPSDTLTPGDVLRVGMRIDTHGIDLGEYQTSITINAIINDASGN